MKTKVKICGIKSLDTIPVLNEMKPDYVGFVFAGSKRRVTYSEAEELRKALAPDIKTVGVFVNEDREFIKKLYDNKIIDIAQLHGDEDNDCIKALKEICGAEVIKAVRVKECRDYEALYPDADYMLYDAFVPGEYGGAGVVFDHSLILPGKKQIFVAGGVTSENVSDIIDKVMPYAVDLSSSLETEGRKDEAKIREFFRKVREKI